MSPGGRWRRRGDRHHIGACRWAARRDGGADLAQRHGAAGATIAANATQSGQGGRVTVLSSASTQMDGSIIARGGRKAAMAALSKCQAKISA